MAGFTSKELDALESGATSVESQVTSLPAFKPVAGPNPLQPPAEAKPSAGFWGTLGAAFKQHNTAVAGYEALTNQYGGDTTFDRDFSPRRKAIEDGLATYADEFNYVRNAAEYEHVKGRVLKAKESKETLENAGGWGAAGATLTAAMLDPVGLPLLVMPMIGQARIAQIASAPVRVAAQATSIAGTGIATGMAQEAILNEVRPTADDQKVAHTYGPTGFGVSANVVAGVGLALFGQAGRAVSAAKKQEVAKAIDSLLVDANGAIVPPTASPAAKAAATPVNPEDSKLYMNAGTKAVDAIVEKGSGGLLEGIGMTLAKSPFDAMRRWGQILTPDIMQRQGTKAGQATVQDAKLLSQMEGNADVNVFGTVVVDTKKSLDKMGQLTPADQAEVFRQFQIMGIAAKTVDDVTPA